MATASDQLVYRATTTAPVNIAVIKYARSVPLMTNEGFHADGGNNIGTGVNAM